MSSWVPFFLLLLLCFSFDGASGARHRKHTRSPAIVTGTVHCHTCFRPKSTHSISGVTVAVESGGNGVKPSFREEVKTTEKAEFETKLPVSTDKLPDQKTFGFPFPPNPFQPPALPPLPFVPSPPSLLPPLPFVPSPPSLLPPLFPSPPPASLLPPLFPSPPPASLFPPLPTFPPWPGLIPSPPPPPPPPVFPIPLPPFPRIPGFPPVPPASSSSKVGKATP